MSVVGSIEVEVHALVDSGQFAREMTGPLNRATATAGTAAGRTMGKQVADSAAIEVEKGTTRIARSGRLLANVFTSNSAAALGPLQEVADKVNLIGFSLEQTQTKAGGWLLGVGAAATGVGAFLSTLASREEGATNRLAASIRAAGGDIDTYQGRIDAAVKSGEQFGQSANQTLDALQALTIGLHDPAKALDELGLVENIAAARQISLGSAANLVRQAYNGNTRVLKAFGIQVSGIVDGQKLLKDAHEKAGKASSDAAKAQHDYDEKLAIYRDTLKPTLSQALALKDAHDKLLKTQYDQAVAVHQQAVAQVQANAAGQKGQQVLDQLAKVTAGQASASADTFTGRLKAWGARIEDVAAGQGKLGHILVTSGPVFAAAGAVVETTLTIKMLRATKAALAMRDAQVLASTEGSAAIEAAAVPEVAALDGVAAAEVAVGDASVAASGTMIASFAAMLPEIALVGAAVIAVYETVKNVKGLIGDLKADNKSTAVGSYRLQHWQAYGDPNPADGPVRMGAGGVVIPDIHDTQTRSDRQAEDDFLHGRNPIKAVTDRRVKAQADAAAALRAQRDKLAKDLAQSNADFLKAAGLGPLPSSAANKALSDAQKEAGLRARQIGKEVTDGIRAQVSTVKQEISGLNAELKKISDVRNQALGQATSFTALTGLLPDNSLATAGSLVGGLKSRVGAEALFGANLKSLSRRGLDKGVISEIIAAGPEQGRAIAAALAAGGDDQIRQLDLAEHAARQQGQVLAGQAVDAQFGVGAQARTNAELARHTRLLAGIEKRLADAPAATGKAVAQAEKNAKVTQTTKSRTAVAH